MPEVEDHGIRKWEDEKAWGQDVLHSCLKPSKFIKQYNMVQTVHRVSTKPSYERTHLARGHTTSLHKGNTGYSKCATGRAHSTETGWIIPVSSGEKARFP